MPYDEIISLGSRCQPAFQIRRITKQQTAHVFDWLITPHAGLIKALKTDFSNFLELENLERGISANKDFKHRHVNDKAYGFLYQHEFLNGISIADDYARIKEKYDFLIARWRQMVEARPSILFIRQAVGKQHPAIDDQTIGERDGEEIVEAIETAYPGLNFKLLVLTPQEREPAHYDKFSVISMKQPDPWEWTGAASDWNDLFSTQASTRNITGTPSDGDLLPSHTM